MPYIKKNDRDKFLLEVSSLSKKIKTSGDLNYVVSLLIHKILKKDGINYQNMNNIIGALESIKLEFYRKIVSSYEEKKINENGSVSDFDYA